MVGEVIGGRYELEELVGSGGMSSVYRATDRLLERPVAVKVLHEYHGADEDTIERFRREARAVAQLSHPNIVTVIDRGHDDGRQYIVFEYIAGENLKQLIERSGPLPVRRALELALEIARGLGFAHRHGLVHRDVKPQNVLLNGEGQAKVTDFGIARSLDVEHNVTQPGTVLGTSNYIAPEQARGDRVDAQTDVYSLGVVLFELLTGEVPFPGDNFVAVAMRHINEEPPSVLELRPEVPLRVASTVERALAKDPRDRFRSMDDFVADLEECLAELGTEPGEDKTLIVRAPAAPPPPRPTPAVAPAIRRRRATRPLAFLVAGLALLALLVAGVLLARLGPDDEGSAAEQPAAIRLVGVGSYDPQGDGREHPERVADATDRDPSTYWTTESYADFDATKEGVGLVLDAGREVELDRVVVETSTPGFDARIDTGASASGPFAAASEEKTVGETTTFDLGGKEARYVVVWITSLPEGVARITEVTARS